jgi:mRNA interferase RelE/StbE
MTFKLSFLPKALKEWEKLDLQVQTQFKQKLRERLENPFVPKDKLHGELSDCYKIKLRQCGYRLVYQINKKEVFILVISVGRRDGFEAYEQATKRLSLI